MSHSPITRLLDLNGLLRKKSHFLLGPRSTGKTFLIRKKLKGECVYLDLLDSDYFMSLSTRPAGLSGIIEADRFADTGIVVIDEVQLIPTLLNEVHRLIESRGWRFLLTGSSARKLKSGHGNLLAGRAWVANLFPLVSNELKKMDLDKYLRWGGLPQVLTSESPWDELKAYAQTYLKEEIQQESLVRSLPNFVAFLKFAALSSGTALNFASLASDAGLKASTVRDYFSILEDTLIGFNLPSWRMSKKRKLVATPKFYLFDTGVTHVLSGTRSLDRNSDLYGRAFEQFIAMELRAWKSYRGIDDELSYWADYQGHEVDFIVGDRIAIEVKATTRTSSNDLKNLRMIRAETKVKHSFLVSQDRVARVQDGIQCLPWDRFLKKLWNGELDS